MLPTIHVAVTAWRRPDCLTRTLSSFLAHNGARTALRLAQGGEQRRTGACPYRFWYGTDGGADPRVHAVAAAHGFINAGESNGHLGIAATTRNLLHAISAQAEDDDLLLLLQEDWESVRPVPVEAVRWWLGSETIGAVRLFGRNRQNLSHDPLPVSDSCLVPGYADTQWMMARPWTVGGVSAVRYEQGFIGTSYWSFPPTVTRLFLALQLLQGARREMDVIRHSLECGLSIVWLMDPVMYHIGFTGWKKMGGKR